MIVLVVYAGVQRLGAATVSKVGGAVDYTLFGCAELSLQDQVGKVKNTAVAVDVIFLLCFNSSCIPLGIERNFKPDFPAFICAEGKDAFGFSGTSTKIFLVRSLTP